MALKLAGNAQQKVLNKAWVDTIDSLQAQRWDNINALKATLADVGTGIKARFDAVLREFPNEGYEQTQALQRMGLLTQELRQFAANLGIDISNQLDGQLADMYTNSYYRNAWQLDIATPDNVLVNFARLSEDQVRAAIAAPFKGGMFSTRLFTIGDETAVGIQQDVTMGILTGRPLDSTAAEIYEKFGDEGKGYFWRAQLIARTETIRARELGRIQLFSENRDLLVTNDKGEFASEWITLESACDDCEDLESRCNDDGEYNLEPIIDSHPNCVCTKRAVLKSWEELGGDEGDEPAYQPFDEWAAEKGIDLTPGAGDLEPDDIPPF